jgi:hypothetical protein
LYDPNNPQPIPPRGKTTPMGAPLGTTNKPIAPVAPNLRSSHSSGSPMHFYEPEEYPPQYNSESAYICVDI